MCFWTARASGSDLHSGPPTLHRSLACRCAHWIQCSWLHLYTEGLSRHFCVNALEIMWCPTHPGTTTIVGLVWHFSWMRQCANEKMFESLVAASYTMRTRSTKSTMSTTHSTNQLGKSTIVQRQTFTKWQTVTVVVPWIFEHVIICSNWNHVQWANHRLSWKVPQLAGATMRIARVTWQGEGTKARNAGHGQAQVVKIAPPGWIEPTSIHFQDVGDSSLGG